MNDQAIEQEIQVKGLTAPRVTMKDIESLITHEYYFSAADGLDGADINGLRRKKPDIVYKMVPFNEDNPQQENLAQITICVLVLENGTKVVGVNEGPVSSENFDRAMGKMLARDKAVNQIWSMLGYELRSKLASK